jgi:two-component system NtrC family sensor kinase
MTRTVLVVDDSLTVRMDLKEAFEAAGFETAPCANLAAARAELAKRQFDVVILDVHLPDGEGFELLAEIRAARGADVAVLMLSTEAEVESRIRGLQVGADDYVGKPYDRGYVISRAHQLLRQRGVDPADLTTILVIDDSPTFRNALAVCLEQAGYAVLAAGTGEEGLRIAADKRPAAVIVDGIMPGIDGPTVIRTMRLDMALRSTPSVLLTGSEGAASELNALDAGADAFVRKEEDLEVILARLAAVLRQTHTSDEAASSLLGPKRVLVADEEDAYREEAAAELRTDGYDVVSAASGEEAVRMLAAQPIDCILLSLGPGSGGREARQRIKASPAFRDAPLIVLMKNDDAEGVVESLSSGADDCIVKSRDFELLRARVRAQIRRRQLEDERRRFREAVLRRELEAADARGARQVAEARAVLVEELERKNKELEAFSYSVSHDLRAPLRSIQAFTEILLAEHAAELGEAARSHLERVAMAGKRMGELIDDLLELSRVSRAELRRHVTDLTAMAHAVALELAKKEPERDVLVEVQEGLVAECDARLLRVVFDNLLGNAWKFTARTQAAKITVGMDPGPVFYVRDNGAGFDMAHVRRLFSPFQRLHNDRDYPGTGIGLATVQRIVDRHGGRVWAEGAVEEGATIHFTIPTAREARSATFKASQ